MAALSIYTPTKVQEAVIPLAMEGKNLLVSSPTGTGKTLAFVIPILEQLSKDPYGVFALILVPVRELAAQIKAVIDSLNTDFTALSLTGGRSLTEQAKLLSKMPHIVISTPGRLADLLSMGEATLPRVFKNLKFLVIDEIDKILIPGVEIHLATILNTLPPKTQRTSLFFSATITSAIQKLQASYGDALTTIDLHTPQSPTSTITHGYVLIPTVAKLGYLLRLIENNPNGQIVVFTSNIRNCHIIGHLFMEKHKIASAATGTKSQLDGQTLYSTSLLHSMLPTQLHRDKALALFRNRKTRILITTDVASRGIDIPNIDLVVNLDLPREIDDYVHRVGRTGRAGKAGRAVSIVSESELALLKKIEDKIGLEFTEIEEFQGDVEKSVVKSLPSLFKLRGEIEVLMGNTGFDEKLEQRKKKRKLN